MAKSRTNCCVFGCHSRSGRDTAIGFHNFPKHGQNKVKITTRAGVEMEMDRRKAWEYAIRSAKQITKHMKVCSRHFKSDDYIFPDTIKRKTLKRTAVPSLCLPAFQVKISDNKRLLRRTKRAEPNDVNASDNAVNEVVEDNNTPAPAPTTSVSSEEFEIAEFLTLLSTRNLPSKKSDKCIQVNSGEFRESFHKKLSNDVQLRTATGLPSLALLNSVTNIINLNLKNNQMKHYKLTVKDRIVLTLLKIKHNLSYSMLALLFEDVTAVTCRRIFQQTVQDLAYVFETAIYMPSREEISKNIPTAFEKFQNVRIVVDCTEIPVQKPPCLCCQVRTYSHYKSTYTIKIMTGVSPSGMITFVSKAYGGRASDKAIFEQSNLIDHLNPEDAVMTDKGFMIDSILGIYGIKLIRPPFLRSKQFTKEEAEMNKSIAAARVHIERSNARIKNFNLLKNKLPWNLAPYYDSILTVVCGIVNLSAPIIGMEGFKHDNN